MAVLKIDRRDQPRGPRSRRALWTLFLVLFALTAVALGGLLLAGRQGWLSLPDRFSVLPQVTVAMVQLDTGRSAEAVVVATGYLESRWQAAIGAKAPGRIQLVAVEEGTEVKKGQVLAVLEHADLDASLAATRATLDSAIAQLAEQQAQLAQDQRDFHRAEELRRRGGLSLSDYEQARARLDVSVAKRESLKAEIALAKARVAEAEQLRENMFIRAPFDGTVISKDAEVGESIMPGGMGEASGRGSVATVADLEHLEVEADVKEDFIGRIHMGQLAEVAIDAVPDRRYHGRVRKIIPMGDRARATIKVKVEVLDADGRLFPEMSSTVYFLPEQTAENATPAAQTLSCPRTAVQHDDRGEFVWLLDDEDRVHRVSVQAGPPIGQRVQIQGGLGGGQRVLVQPPAHLRDGQRVRPQTSS